MPSTSYDTAFEVALSTGFILYYILVRACIAAETPHGHLSNRCVGVWKCVVFPCCATKGNPWICCYIKQYFTLGVDISAVSIYK
jgi:hypothetical protein